MADNLDVPPDPLQDAQRRIAELEARMEEIAALMAGWPTPATLLQGFLSGRWQRRDGDGYQQALTNIPEAPADNYYYGRHNYGWAQVVEEAPGLTSRRSTTGWARASFGSDTPWINMDDVLINYVPEVPIGAAAYARVRDGDGAVGWSNVNALGYLSTSGGQMTGPLITRDGGNATNPGLAVGDNSTGFYRTAGNLLVTTVSGVIVMQLQPTLVAFFISVNFTGKPLNGVGDPVLADDALNLRTGDARYAPISGSGNFLPISGGTLTGQLVTQSGTGSRDLAIGVGDDTTGLYRQNGALSFMALGFPLLLLDGSNRSAALIGPLNMSGNIIGNIANPGLGGDALNLQTGDTRYLTLLNGGIVQGPVQLLSTPVTINDAVTKGYVDQSLAAARTPAVIFDLPADVAIAGDGAWHELARVTFPIARTGLSRIQVTLNCNLNAVNNVASVAARLTAGGVERRMFAFGVTPGGESVGFVCNLYFDTSPGVINIPIELASLVLTGSPIPFTVIGGAVAARSQIVVTDLGPIG
jgi:hypothetical protein